MASLFIPLKYQVCVKPRPDEYKILHDASPEGFWRICDTDPSSEALIVDCLPGLRLVANELNSKYADATDKDLVVIIDEGRLGQDLVTISMFSHEVQLLNQERAELLRAYQPVETLVESIDAGHDITALFDKLDEISDYTGTSIVATSFGSKGGHASHRGDEKVQINIYGSEDSVKDAHKQVSIANDVIIKNYAVDSVDLPLSLLPLVCGVRSGNLQTIEDESKVKFYAPNILSELFATTVPHNDSKVTRNLNEIYLTGKTLANIELGKHMLQEVIRRTNPLVHKDCVVSFAKIDLLILKYQREIKHIMSNHGTYIQLPYLGACRSLVRVVGVNAWSVENSIRELMILTTNFYNVSYMRHTGQRDESNEILLEKPHIDTPMPHLVSPSHIEGHYYNPPRYDLDETSIMLERIASTSGAVITSVGSAVFDIVGYKADARKATTMMPSLPSTQHYEQQIVYRLEVELEQKDFIAGKKHGKIHRIMKNSNVWIRFLPFNEYNFYVSLEADKFSHAQSGIQLLEDELPAEMSFFIPEMFHKQVIGQGGQRIQSIMRKYNVFVKFSNDHDEYPNAYSLEEPNNVIVRCPSKNAKNIADARAELMETVGERSTVLCNTFVHMSRSHRRILVTEKATYIRDIESKTNSVILLPPDVINGPDGVVEVQGLASHSEDSSRMLKTILPEDYEFKIAYSKNFAAICNADEGDFFREIVVPFRVALHMEVEVYQEPRKGSGNTSVPASSMITTQNTATPEKMPSKYHRIVISYSAEYSAGLEGAIQGLTSFLRAKGLSILDRGDIHGDPVEEGSAATIGHQRKADFFGAKTRGDAMMPPMGQPGLGGPAAAPPPGGYFRYN